jgi:hypothetical protein
MTLQDAIQIFKSTNCYGTMDIAKTVILKALEQEPCKVLEYDKDHIWYKGSQYISLRRFLEVKAETKQEPCEVKESEVIV